MHPFFSSAPLALLLVAPQFARVWVESLRLLPAAARGRTFRALGAADRRCEAQARILSRREQARSVQGRLYFRTLRPFARLDRRSDAGAARRCPRTRHGLAVRLLQPEIMALGQRRER